MPTRETAPIGAPCWVDLMTSDTERSRAFYCDLFGWAAEDPVEEHGGYFNFTKDGVRVAGCMANQPGSGTPDVWSVHLATDDAATTVAAASVHGGQVHVQPMAVGDLGTMAFVGDPGGAGIGVWQPGRHKGFGVYGETGTPAWFELLTRDYDAAVGFYRDVFRWSTHVTGDAPEFRYTTLVDGASWLAGIMDASGFLPEGVPAHWSVYFGVEDTDAAVARIVDLGGSVLQPAEDTPYGRLAAAADQTGARLKLVAPNEAMPAAGSSGAPPRLNLPGGGRTVVMRRVPVLVAVVLSLVLVGPPAGGQTVLGQAGEQLRRDRVYVDPGADPKVKIDDAAERRLEERIRRSETPIFIAIVPASAIAEAGGDASAVPRALSRTVGFSGTYAVIAGTSFRAYSDTVRGVPGIASAVFDRNNSSEEVLSDFVERAQRAAAGNGSPSGGGSGGSGGGSGSSDGGGGGSGVLPLLLLIGAGGGGFYLWRRGKVRRAEEERQEANDRQVLQAEMSVLGEDVMALEPHISLVPEAREDYEAGVNRYRSAQAALDYADDPVDLVRVGRVIAEGRYAMTRARARVEGREPPPPPEELRRPGRHDEPALDVDEAGQPVYVGYPGGFYGGGGWFGGGGGGGLLTGLLLGQMLGGGFGWGGGFGGGWGGGGHDGGHDGGDGGGGDWGGGGGGDWGGGDFGGGDFGGGGGDW